MLITNDIRYVGVNDHKVDLFEGQYVVKNGMAYNSYVIMDDKIAVMDTVDAGFGDEWLGNIKGTLGAYSPDYLIVQHMEPDHSANIVRFMEAYPKAQIVSTAKAFAMMRQFYGMEFEGRRIVVSDTGMLPLGKHELHFIFAPMVHWPEVMVTYDSHDKVLFSADGFGKFGALDADEPWDDEARRYYIGIVGKYGGQVMKLLKAAETLDISIICPLHGSVLNENLAHYIDLYRTWASYEPEEDGVVIAYTSVYGHTKAAVELLREKLMSGGCPAVEVYDLARQDMSEAVAAAFRYSRLVLATTTYNADIYPFMKEFINHLTERGFKNRTVALVENGSWAPLAAKTMRKLLEESRSISFAQNVVHIKSALSDESRAELDAMAKELCAGYSAQSADASVMQDPKAMYSIGYGLYVLTTNDTRKDNGCIVNAVMQVTGKPNRMAVAINKSNYSCETVTKTGILNINCLSVKAPFEVFKRFGFQSGRDVDKFAGSKPARLANGLVVLSEHVNAVMGLKVYNSIDLGTHILFLCDVTESRVISRDDTMTYAYYQKNVKPKPQTEQKKGFVCKICGYIYEGDELPDDFICPLCKHPASDFEPLK